MALNRTDIERAIEHFNRTESEPTQKHVSAWLRMQGVTFSDRVFRKLYREVENSRVEYKGVKAKAAVDPSTSDLPESQLPLFGGRLYTPDTFRRKIPGSRFFCSVVQNNTRLHNSAWNTLQRFCAETNTTLLLSRCSYNKNGWQKVTTESEDLWYDERAEPYFIDEQVKLADDLVFCAELDILPTASWPLNGLDNYTGHNSAIIPHTKMQMKSLATMKNHPAKLLYSTGALTLRNYIQRRTGQIAEYHHVFGGMLVEVDKDGDWFARQINFNSDGSFIDLDTEWGVSGSAPSKGSIVNLGDIHAEKIDPVSLKGALSMLDSLNPRAIVCHDTLDFTNRNHHNKRDPFFIAEQEVSGETVENNVYRAARIMQTLAERFPDAVVYNIRSNHDEALRKWLMEGSTFTDPKNARYWHELNAAIYKAIEEGNTDFDVYKYAMQKTGCLNDKTVVFVKEDQSVILEGIEFGLHGHLGANGARGNPRQYRQLGRRVNSGHTHSAGIIDGVWTAGVMALDMGYNRGPSSWSVSHIITHSGGKRQIVTQRGSKWRA